MRTNSQARFKMGSGLFWRRKGHGTLPKKILACLWDKFLAGFCYPEMSERTRHWKRGSGKPLYCLSPFVTVFSSPNVPFILAVRYHRKQPGPYPRNTLVFISGVSGDFSLPTKRHSPFGNGLGSSAAPPVGWMLPISGLRYRLGIGVWLWGSASRGAKR